MRAQDGFSKDLLAYAQTHGKVTVRIDGPYGSQSSVEMLQSSDICAIGAAGSGIAVAWPLLWAILDERPEKAADVERRPSHYRSRKILFVWVVQKASHHSWLGTHGIDALRARDIDVVMPLPTEEVGRPDVGAVLEAWTCRSDDGGFQGRCRIGVVCAGPEGMARGVRNVGSGLGRGGRDVSVCVENFSW